MNFGNNNSNNNSNNGKRLLSIASIAMFTAIIILCAQIQIPLGEIPFTLQTLGVFVASAMLGFKKGIICTSLYMLMGFIGLPVFAGFAGGAGTMLGPTGGYIIGFIFMAAVIGFMTDMLGKRMWVLIVSMISGLALLYIFGTIWFVISTKTDFLTAVMLCVVPYIIADGLKIAVASVLVNRLGKFIK